MTSIHLSNIFGLPPDVEKIAYWRVFGQKLVSSCTAGMFSWEQAQSFHIIGGIPIQANGMQFLARIPNVPDDEELLPSLTAGVWIFSNGLCSVGDNGELASASPVEKRHLQLVLEPKSRTCPASTVSARPTCCSPAAASPYISKTATSTTSFAGRQICWSGRRSSTGASKETKYLWTSLRS